MTEKPPRWHDQAYDNQTWETAMPMLWDICERHGGRIMDLRRWLTPNDHPIWVCRSCWIRHTQERRDATCPL